MKCLNFSDDNDYDLVHSIIEKELSTISLRTENELSDAQTKNSESFAVSKGRKKMVTEVPRDDAQQPQINGESYDHHHDNYFDAEGYSSSEGCATDNTKGIKENSKISISKSCKISFPLHLHNIDEEKDALLMKNKSLSNFQNAIHLLNSKPLSSPIYYKYLANNILTISATSEGLDYFTKKLKVTPYIIIKGILSEVLQDFVAFLAISINSKSFLLRLYPILTGIDRIQVLSALVSSIPVLSISASQMNLSKLIIEKISTVSEQEYLCKNLVGVISYLLSSSNCFGFLDSVVSKVSPPHQTKLIIEIFKNIECMYEKKVAYYFYKKLILNIKDEDTITFIVDIIVSLMDSMPYTQYGSLIIQTVLKTFDLEYISKLLNSFGSHIIKFAVGKHSPRILEAALDYGREVFFDLFYANILKHDQIKYLLNTANGYYIIEKALQKCPSVQCLQEIRYNIFLNNNQISNNLRPKFEKVLMDFTPNMQGGDFTFKSNSFTQFHPSYNASEQFNESKIQYPQRGSFTKNALYQNPREGSESFNLYHHYSPFYANQIPQVISPNLQKHLYYVVNPMHPPKVAFNNNYSYILNTGKHNSLAYASLNLVSQPINTRILK